MADKEFSLINLKDVSEPINKLIEAVGGAIGALYEPTALRRRAKAEADASLVKAVADLKIQSLTDRAEERRRVRILRQQSNIESIVSKSTSLLPEKCKSQGKVNEDWVYEFFDSCQNCSDENLQVIWAKILSGEIDEPGSFSRRALHTVKVMSAEEANLFTRYCSYCWELRYDKDKSMVGIFQHYKNGESDNHAGSRLDHALRSFDLTTKDQHILHTLGLISLGTIVESGSQDSFVLNYDDLTYAATPREIGVSLEIAPLSELGAELFPICGASPEKEYMDTIFEYLDLSGYDVYEAEVVE